MDPFSSRKTKNTSISEISQGGQRSQPQSKKKLEAYAQLFDNKLQAKDTFSQLKRQEKQLWSDIIPKIASLISEHAASFPGLDIDEESISQAKSPQSLVRHQQDNHSDNNTSDQQKKVEKHPQKHIPVATSTRDATQSTTSTTGETANRQNLTKNPPSEIQWSSPVLSANQVRLSQWGSPSTSGLETTITAKNAKPVPYQNVLQPPGTAPRGKFPSLEDVAGEHTEPFHVTKRNSLEQRISNVETLSVLARPHSDPLFAKNSLAGGDLRNHSAAWEIKLTPPTHQGIEQQIHSALTVRSAAPQRIEKTPHFVATTEAQNQMPPISSDVNSTATDGSHAKMLPAGTMSTDIQFVADPMNFLSPDTDQSLPTALSHDSLSASPLGSQHVDQTKNAPYLVSLASKQRSGTLNSVATELATQEQRLRPDTRLSTDSKDFSPITVKAKTSAVLPARFTTTNLTSLANKLQSDSTPVLSSEHRAYSESQARYQYNIEKPLLSKLSDSSNLKNIPSVARVSYESFNLKPQSLEFAVTRSLDVTSRTAQSKASTETELVGVRIQYRPKNQALAVHPAARHQPERKTPLLSQPTQNSISDNLADARIATKQWPYVDAHRLSGATDSTTAINADQPANSGSASWLVKDKPAQQIFGQNNFPLSAERQTPESFKLPGPDQRVDGSAESFQSAAKANAQKPDNSATVNLSTMHNPTLHFSAQNTLQNMAQEDVLNRHLPAINHSVSLQDSFSIETQNAGKSASWFSAGGGAAPLSMGDNRHSNAMGNLPNNATLHSTSSTDFAVEINPNNIWDNVQKTVKNDGAGLATKMSESQALTTSQSSITASRNNEVWHVKSALQSMIQNASLQSAPEQSQILPHQHLFRDSSAPHISYQWLSYADDSEDSTSDLPETVSQAVNPSLEFLASESTVNTQQSSERKLPGDIWHQDMERISNAMLEQTAREVRNSDIKLVLQDALFAGSEVKLSRQNETMSIVLLPNNHEVQAHMLQHANQLLEKMNRRFPHQTVMIKLKSQDGKLLSITSLTETDAADTSTTDDDHSGESF